MPKYFIAQLKMLLNVQLSYNSYQSYHSKQSKRVEKGNIPKEVVNAMLAFLPLISRPKVKKNEKLLLNFYSRHDTDFNAKIIVFGKIKFASYYECSKTAIMRNVGNKFFCSIHKRIIRMNNMKFCLPF